MCHSKRVCALHEPVLSVFVWANDLAITDMGNDLFYNKHKPFCDCAKHYAKNALYAARQSLYGDNRHAYDCNCEIHASTWHCTMNQERLHLDTECGNRGDSQIQWNECGWTRPPER